MSNPKHPIMTFQVNLGRLTSEKIGPNTNQKTVTLLHPDMHDSSADRGRTNSARYDSHKVTWLPGLLGSENIVENDDGTITAYGLKAKYLLDTYTTGDAPVLTLLSNTFESA